MTPQFEVAAGVVRRATLAAESTLADRQAGVGE
jgi:hypothetical protein